MRLRPGNLKLPRLTLGGVARNVVVVGGGTALGQGALVVAAPVLARSYDPESFGLLSVYSALLLVLVAVSALRFDFAIPISTNASEAIHLLALSVVLVAAFSVVSGLTVIVWGTQVTAALGAAPLAAYIWLLPFALFVAGVGQALSSWAVYLRTFPVIGRVRAIQGVGQATSQAALGLLHVGPLGLLLGDTVGRMFGSGELLRNLFPSMKSARFSLADMRRYARQRWGFARVMTAASLVGAVSLQIPFLLIPAFFDLQSSGQYFLAYRLLVLPASLVAAAVSQVFLGEASFRKADPGRLHDLARNVAVTLLAFSIPTYGIITFTGPALVEAVFGPQWALAGVIAQIMAPSLILWSVTGPVSGLLVVGSREKESFGFTILGLLVGIASLGIGGLLNSLTTGLVILTATSVLLHVVALWRFLRVAFVGLRELVRPAARILMLTIPSIALVLLVGQIDASAMVLASGVGWSIAVGLAVRFSPEVRGLMSGSND